MCISLFYFMTSNLVAMAKNKLNIHVKMDLHLKAMTPAVADKMTKFLTGSFELLSVLS